MIFFVMTMAFRLNAVHNLHLLYSLLAAWNSALKTPLFYADEAFFIVNGTTAAVQAMIMASCKYGEKVIMPRNVHRSAINDDCTKLKVFYRI